MGALPRGNKLKPLVSEFATYHTAICDPQQQPKQPDSVLKLLPKGARVTHRRLISGEVFRGDATLRASSVKSSDIGGPAQTVEVCSIGVPGDPIEFLQKAVEAGRPRSLESNLDTLVERVVDENFLQNWLRGELSSSASGMKERSFLTRQEKTCWRELLTTSEVSLLESV